MTGRFFALEDTVRLIGRHLEAHSASSKASHRLRLAGDCQSPVLLERQARPRKRFDGTDKFGDPVLTREAGHVLFLDMEVPCRRCAACRKRRADHWRLRALEETRAAPRTWFVTLTLTDHEQFVALARADQLAAKSGRSFSAVDDDDRQRLLVRAVSPELTRYWKRVRKNSGAPLKFMWVAEFASSGVRGEWNLHFHALVHEVRPDKPVRKSVLREAWRLGFSRFKLVVDDRQVAYICKYISKSFGAGVRSSQRYGKGSLPRNSLNEERAVTPSLKKLVF